jgi:hypothetical protein
MTIALAWDYAIAPTCGAAVAGYLVAMYTIPIVLLLALAVIAVAWTPVFALVIAVPLFIALLAYRGLRPRADERIDTPAGAVERQDDVPKGAWGEPRT